MKSPVGWLSQACDSVEARLLPRGWFLRRRLSRNARFYRKELEKLKARGAADDERDALRFEWVEEARTIEEEGWAHFTERLVRRAERFWVPTPERPIILDDEPEDRDPHWRRGIFTGEYYLTPLGVSKVRNAIREERKARREALLAWLPLITALTALITGALGTLTGLLAVLGQGGR